MRYLVYCSYDGTRYVGWQKQTKGISVQSSVEEALGIFFSKRLILWAVEGQMQEFMGGIMAFILRLKLILTSSNLYIKSISYYRMIYLLMRLLK